MSRRSTQAGASSKGTTRDAMLKRVRRAIGADRAAAPPVAPPAIDHDLVRPCHAEDDLVVRFVDRAEALAVVVHRTAEDAIADAVVEAMHATDSRIFAGAFAPQRFADLADQLAQRGFERVDWRERGVDCLFDVDAGITDVEAALAETGSLICTSDADHPRGASLIPPVHIAVVERGDLLPDMLDYWARLEARGEAASQIANINFITGPSKTADIEGILVRGAHGPKALHVVLVG